MLYTILTGLHENVWVKEGLVTEKCEPLCSTRETDKPCSPTNLLDVTCHFIPLYIHLHFHVLLCKASPVWGTVHRLLFGAHTLSNFLLPKTQHHFFLYQSPAFNPACTTSPCLPRNAFWNHFYTNQQDCFFLFFSYSLKLTKLPWSCLLSSLPLFLFARVNWLSEFSVPTSPQSTACSWASFPLVDFTSEDPLASESTRGSPASALQAWALRLHRLHRLSSSNNPRLVTEAGRSIKSQTFTDMDSFWWPP